MEQFIDVSNINKDYTVHIKVGRITNSINGKYKTFLGEKMINQAIKYEIIENIGIIKGTNPPVNALSFDVRKGLIDALNFF